ncbi:MAG: c-type cytochrome [Deltaproteobacteria bacterium]|nr:c-type cytochrome [Deltaproteobacteria bacterium]
MKPSSVRPGTIMPDSGLSADEAQAIAYYLWTTSAPAKTAGSVRGGDARQGEKLFVTRGCRGCHAVTAGESGASNRVPNLSGIGLKVKGDWLFDWIKSPRRYHPQTAMPQLSLSDDEIRHLVAFLLTRKDGARDIAGVKFSPGDDTNNGKKLIARYECIKCHELKGFPLPTPAYELTADTGKDAVLKKGRQMIAYYNCRGCHQIEGSGGTIAEFLERKTFAPPTLEGEGARVQTSWLVHFLQQPATLRPWLEMRMPNYGFSEQQAKTVAQYMAALANVEAKDEPIVPAADEATARGLRRLAHFKCIQCHPATADKQLPADVDPENLSINLTLAKSRLRPSWIKDFLTRPKAIAGTQTRMPAIFYNTEGVAKVDQPDKDIDSIATYLLHMTESPDVALAKLEAARKHEQQAPATDWSKMDY